MKEIKMKEMSYKLLSKVAFLFLAGCFFVTFSNDLQAEETEENPYGEYTSEQLERLKEDTLKVINELGESYEKLSEDNKHLIGPAYVEALVRAIQRFDRVIDEQERRRKAGEKEASPLKETKNDLKKENPSKEKVTSNNSTESQYKAYTSEQLEGEKRDTLKAIKELQESYSTLSKENPDRLGSTYIEALEKAIKRLGEVTEEQEQRRRVDREIPSVPKAEKGDLKIEKSDDQKKAFKHIPTSEEKAEKVARETKALSQENKKTPTGKEVPQGVEVVGQPSIEVRSPEAQQQKSRK